MADNNDYDNSSDEDDDIFNEDYLKQSFTLIAIDASPQMFMARPGCESTPFEDCIKAVYHIYDCLLFKNPRQTYNQVSVIIASNDYKNEKYTISFKDNIVDSRIFLNKVLDKSLDDFTKSCMRLEGEFDISSFLLHCKKEFDVIKTPISNRTLVFLTVDEDPTKGDKNIRFTALNEAQNFLASDLSFQLVTLVEDFDYTKFYNEFFSVSKLPMQEEIFCRDVDGLIEKLKSMIVFRMYRSKIVMYPFPNNEKRFVKCYEANYIKDVKLLPNAYITTDNKVAKKATAVDEDKVTEYHVKGNRSLTAEEVLQVRCKDIKPGIYLLKILKSMMQKGLVLKKSKLLALDESEDSLFFRDAWQYCKSEEKVLYCLYKNRASSKPHFIELSPYFINNSKMFIIKRIPFAQDHSMFQSEEKVESIDENSENIEAQKLFKKLVKKLRFQFDPSYFCNMEYNKMMGSMKSKLLGEPIEEILVHEVDDESVSQRAGKLEEMLNNMFHFEYSS